MGTQETSIDCQRPGSSSGLAVIFTLCCTEHLHELRVLRRIALEVFTFFIRADDIFPLNCDRSNLSVWHSAYKVTENNIFVFFF